MTKRLNKLALAFSLPLLFALSSTSFGQQVFTTTVGSPVKFEIVSKIQHGDFTQCSIIVTQPNGSTEVLILQAPDFKTSLSYIPTTQGTTVVSWKGEITLNGKVENQVSGAVKQLFGNLGELLTFNKLSQSTMACPGSGTITVVATPNVQPTR